MGVMTAVNPLSIRDEADFLLTDVRGLARLGETLRQLGYPNQQVQGLIGWLAFKAAGLKDETTPVTRSRYRSILRSLDPDTLAVLHEAMPELVKSPARAA